MNVKKRLETLIRGWLPKEDNVPRDKLKMAETEVSKTKPWWWKPLWLVTMLAAIASAATGFFLFDVPLTRAIRAVVLTFLGLSIAYYIRVRPSITVNRAVYIIFGASATGLTVQFGTALIIAATGLPPPINFLGFLGFVILFMITPNVIGAFIGDWIGKRRNYLLPLTP
jgi:hypothetical protein